MDEPGQDVEFNLVSSLRAAHRDGPWLLLFHPTAPEGWVITGIEITDSGDVTVKIQSRREGMI